MPAIRVQISSKCQPGKLLPLNLQINYKNLCTLTPTQDIPDTRDGRQMLKTMNNRWDKQIKAMDKEQRCWYTDRFRRYD